MMNELVSIDRKEYKTTLSCFGVVTDDVVMKILQTSPKKSCIVNPLPKCKSEIIPILTHVTNMSVDLSHIPISLKSAMVKPMLKACNLSLLLKTIVRFRI